MQSLVQERPHPRCCGIHVAVMSGDTRETLYIPGQLASTAASSALHHCCFPNCHHPAITPITQPILTFFFFFTKKKKEEKKKNQQNFTPQNECDLGWTPGKREEKKKLPLLIYFNRTRQNSFLLEINTKPCRICTPYNSKPTAPPPCSSASSSLLQHCK